MSKPSVLKRSYQPHLTDEIFDIFIPRGKFFDTMTECFVCGNIQRGFSQMVLANVESVESGHRIRKLFGRGTKLVESDAPFIRIKVGACVLHVEALDLLIAKTYERKIINQDIIREIIEKSNI